MGRRTGALMSDLTVCELGQSEWEHWDQWLALQPWGSPFSAAWWLDANCRAFGGHPLLLGVLDGDQLVGGLALRVMDVGPLHMVRSSMLYNPVVIAAGSAHSRQKVLGTLLEDVARRRLVVPPLTCTPDMVDLRQAVWHHWNMTAGWTVMSDLTTWTVEDVSRSEREKIKKSRRAEVTACIEPPDADLLYELLQATMSRQGQSMRLTRGQLRTLIEAAGTHGMQTTVRDEDGTPLSSGFDMSHGTRVAYDIWSGTSASGLAKGAAVARYVFRQRELRARGYEYLDWCGANLPGVSDFKLEFGGALTTRLAISREPLWFRALFPAYVRLSELRGSLKQREG
jgi:hypothetical protein